MTDFRNFPPGVGTVTNGHECIFLSKERQGGLKSLCDDERLIYTPLKEVEDNVKK